MDFRVLGTLEVWTDAGRVMVPSPRHQRVLAALLLAANSVVPVARLVDAVWHDEPPVTATKQIQNCVSVLRERLGRERDVIITDGPGYQLSIGDDELDAIRFQRGMVVAHQFAAEGSRRRAVATARDALRLWRGPALDGLDAIALAGPITKLNEQRYNAIETCAEWQLQLGDHQAVVEELGELVAFHPLRERMHGQLMAALDGCGRPADALAVFGALRARLAGELGVEPGPGLRAQQARILAGTRGKSSPATGSPPVPADRAPRQLAAAVARQWTAEVELRSLNRPEPVPLTWSSTGRPVTAGAALSRHDVASRGERLVFSGDLRDVVAKFRQVRSRQLVVLGDPGAGKSVLAMLFTLGLLADRREGEPVPVLLPLASWNPHREHLRHWLAAKLVEDYPGLGNKAVYGADAATRLVSDRRIVPVLDGLDEIPPALHAAAIDALDRAVADGSPLVVTCRATEYEKAVTQSGSLLARAAVVEIEPVGAEAAIEFLTARTRAGETRWRPVEQRLRRQPDSPLAQALRTPLMVDLARAAYADPKTDPGELCDTDRFGGPELIEDHLLDAYLPAGYAHRPTPPAPDGRPVTPRTYDPRQAERWLGFLARRLQDQRTRDLAWWRLDRMMPRHVAGLYLGLPPALLFAATGWVAAGPIAGLVYGLSFGLAGWLAHTLGERPGPLRVELRFHRTTSRFLWRFLAGAVAGSLLALGWSLSPPVIALLAVLFGLAIAPHVWLDTPIDAGTVTSPATVLRGDRTAALAYTLSFVMCMGPFWGIAFALTNETRFVTILGGDFDLVLALATGLASGLLGRFMLGTAGGIAYGLAGAVVGGQVLPRATSATQAVIAGILFGLAVGLAVCLARAWGAFTMMRLWLAARGHLPWHLMGFLADAHRRGVLRQVGGVYQFRHERLQARLAGLAEPTARS
ncbi:NACHT domain-containing protein [Amycolatopsis balhimycina DSM 5908]|uniref:NACHT domain-containing protein n=1 Tax=Amycolatopsis balhimycina DSM 5908 TaxID=1081091 RepID=A0A428WVK2_AMYBA|nr:NACHT domain-containing protein [Amycolatopsis balhimycina DSM 5908]